MPIWLVLLSVIAYMAVLFAIAWQRDQQATKPGFTQSPIIYALAIAVYCTSWTFFGAVGTAASSGWDYLPIYLGPALVFLFLPGLLRRIGNVAERESVTSLSDFLASRYGKSRALGALVAVAAVMGSLPYIALQLKSVGMSVQALLNRPGDIPDQPGAEPVLVTAIGLAVFAILFGARHADLTKHNAGLMRVLAFEAIVKIAALIAVCFLSISLLQDVEPEKIASFADAFAPSDVSTRFITITLLSMAAILCLPRQFHVAIIERRNQSEQNVARWLFPSYLLVTSLVVLPITLAGSATLPDFVPADLYVLELPLMNGDGLLAMFVFLGGFSAATGMVIVATIALSNMVTNELIVPAFMRSGYLPNISGDAGERLLTIRRIVIVAIILLAYGYFRIGGSSEALAQIGLLSFAAAAQFAPALLGAVYWRGARQPGAFAGLSIGMVIWTFTLFLPALIGVEAMTSVLPGWLSPHALFGVGFGDSLVHGVIWSLGLNTLLFIAFSLRAPERLRDRIQSAAFVGDITGISDLNAPSTAMADTVTPDGLKALASRFLSAEAVGHAFDQFASETGIATSGRGPADWRIVQRTERLLASALGASSARVVMSSAVGGADVALGDVLSILDQRTQAERFDRHMLQSMLENIEHGISVVDHEQRLVAWNSGYVDMFAYPAEIVKVGAPISSLIEHNIATGWIDGDPAHEANRRIAHIKAGRPHMYERQNPDGRHLRIVGSPMPGGGYVTTFMDITEDKKREQALIVANETLEQRVQDRTQDLQIMAEDLEAARAEAEGANASKTRFLAAASHDLLQPLNAARLFLGAVDTAGGTKSEELLEKADRAVRSADELLKGLLDISRLDHSSVEPVPQTLPLGPLLEDLADEARPMATAAGLHIALAPTSLKVSADPDFLQSILRNFISNARRYTQEGGILIGARRVGDNQVRIEVWDTGPGIPDDKREQLFGEFERLAEQDNMGIRGAGLGLAVATRMATLMGTRLELRSVVGKGSVFSVTVPRVAAKAVSHRTAISKKANPSGSLSGLTVLCVDDEPIILEGMEALLQRWNCTVYTAQDIVSAQAVLRTHTIDCVIADFQLKLDQNGLDFLIETQERAPSLHVALLTAEATQNVLNRAAAANISVLHKPADPEDIRSFLLNTRSADRTQAAE
ncbi:MAG: PAS-domain containing protein [Henriciella sp.]|nr:PAS-domain containing protein [Henriciella sp.]